MQALDITLICVNVMTLADYRQELDNDSRQTFFFLGYSPSTLGREDNFLSEYSNEGIYFGVPLGAWQTDPGLYFHQFSEFEAIPVSKVM